MSAAAPPTSRSPFAPPGYLERNGIPSTLADLEAHNCIGFNLDRKLEGWPFRTCGGVQALPTAGNVLVGDGESARRLALAGVGLARLALFHVGPDIASGRLTPVLEELNPGDTQDVHAIFVGQGGHLPARVRALIDFLADASARRANDWSAGPPSQLG